MPTNGTGSAKVERAVAAILAADVTGYNPLMGADEEATVHDLKRHQMSFFRWSRSSDCL
jgi:class 3 adenylate cyclase